MISNLGVISMIGQGRGKKSGASRKYSRTRVAHKRYENGLWLLGSCEGKRGMFKLIYSLQIHL